MPPYVYDETGRRVPAPSKGERRERAILDAAEAQLDELGADTMTVESIANAAGITRASLYFYFRSKNDVLAALVRRAVDELTSGVATADHATAGSASESLGEALRRTADLWERHGAVMRVAVELAPRVPAIGELWNTARADIEQHALRIALTAGATAGDAPDAAAAVVRSLVAMTERSFYDASTDPSSLREAIGTQQIIWTRALELD